MKKKSEELIGEKTIGEKTHIYPNLNKICFKHSSVKLFVYGSQNYNILLKQSFNLRLF